MYIDIVLSTGNPSKTVEARDVFDGSVISVRSRDEAGITGRVEEDGETLEENALKKALFVHNQAAGIWAVADDTELSIDILGGEPGVRTARWLREDASVEETMQYCLARMNGIVYRDATFRTVVVAISPDGKKHVFTGEVRGRLLHAPRVSPRPMMPYSALFVPEGDDRALAEMTIAEENEISHRGQAFRKLRAFLEQYSLQST